MGLLIYDGYTLDAAINVRGHGKPVNLKYRPALWEERQDYFLAPKNNGKEFLKAALGLLDKHIVWWDATEGGPDGAKTAIELNAESIRRVPAAMFDRMLDLVLGLGEQETQQRQDADAKN